jgi:ribosomal protein L22
MSSAISLHMSSRVIRGCFKIRHATSMRTCGFSSRVCLPSSLRPSSSSIPIFQPSSQLSPSPRQFRASLFSTSAQEGTEVGAEGGAVVLADDFETDEVGWSSTATREVSHGKRENVRCSPRKMSEICRMVRGLSVEEALIQLQFSQKRNAKYLAFTINSAATAGVNNFFMDRDRLVIDYANSTKGANRKFMRFRAKGRGEINKVYYCHIRVGVKEQPYEADEVRIGRYGRTIAGIKRTKKLIAEERAKRNEKAEFLKEFAE